MFKSLFISMININKFDFFVEFFIFFFPFIYIFFIIFSVIFFFKKKKDYINNFYKFNINIKTLYSIAMHISYISFIYPIIIGIFANILKIKNKLYHGNAFIRYFDNIGQNIKNEQLFFIRDIEDTFIEGHIIYKNINYYDIDFLSFFLNLDCFKLYFIILSNMILFLCLVSFYNQIFDKSFYNYEEQARVFNINDMKVLATNIININVYNKIYFIWFIFSLQLILHILFTTDNILYFFITFEASVLPIFAIVGFFGKRSLKFKAMNYLLYFTLFSAIPIVIVIAVIYYHTGTVYYSSIKFYFFNSEFSNFTNKLIFLGFFIPFAVKLALFPFHTWLPEAHVEASTEGSMILSGIMLKLGFFGIVRFCLSFFPFIIMDIAPFILFFAMIGAISTSFSMYKQLDIKKIIAYSSVVHMNIAIFGYFCGSQTGIQGALLFSFSHGVASAGLFCAVGYLHDKIKTRNLLEISGLWVFMPRWSFFFFILLLANAGMPGTIGFIAEISIISGIFEYFPVLGVIILLPISIAAYRNYLLFTQICMGIPSTYMGSYEVSSFSQKNIDCNISKSNIFIIKDWDIHYTGEGVVLGFISLFSIYTGICPQYFIYLLEWTSVYLEIKFF